MGRGPGQSAGCGSLSAAVFADATMSLRGVAPAGAFLISCVIASDSGPLLIVKTPPKRRTLVRGPCRGGSCSEKPWTAPFVSLKRARFSTIRAPERRVCRRHRTSRDIRADWRSPWSPRSAHVCMVGTVRSRFRMFPGPPTVFESPGPDNVIPVESTSWVSSSHSPPLSPRSPLVSL
jgi:hypothetical protein